MVKNMEEKLLSEIELDVQELKCLLQSFQQLPNGTLSELVKRSIRQTQAHLSLLAEQVESAASPIVNPAERCMEEPAKQAAEEETSTLVLETALSEGNAETLSASSSLNTEEIGYESAIPFFAEKTDSEEGPVREEKALTKDSPKNESAILGEHLKVYSGGLQQFISLNDSFRFARELFSGQAALNKALAEISALSSYEDAVAYIAATIAAEEGNETYNDFMEIVGKYFNQSA